MNVYDHAHALAKAIKQSPEFRNYKKNQEKLENDKSAKEMLTDFRKSQWELQQKKMSGVEVDPEQEKRLAQAMEIINLNRVVKEYLEAEYRFSILLADIQKIIASPFEDLISQEISEQQSAQPRQKEEQQKTKQQKEEQP
ncbi:MAG TPA: YlbF family regulator [Firmicutes bacterium]|jgi:cell fate (sporulation/competence/biofilm development) regulator YlbF (YheA/YmcA/DUF963 family)|nr:YlbF family regulator [Bacillota bacterium]